MQSRAFLMPAVALAVLFALQSTASHAETQIGSATRYNPIHGEFDHTSAQIRDILRTVATMAAQVIRAVGVANMRDLQPYLRLRPEGIEIAPVPTGSDLGPLLDKIKRTPNIPLARKPTIVMPAPPPDS